MHSLLNREHEMLPYDYLGSSNGHPTIALLKIQRLLALPSEEFASNNCSILQPKDFLLCFPILASLYLTSPSFTLALHRSLVERAIHYRMEKLAFASQAFLCQRLSAKTTMERIVKTVNVVELFPIFYSRSEVVTIFQSFNLPETFSSSVAT
nr:hypothetical protein L203_06314 [Cryptococcus depauperatus CBS 7841]